VLFGGLMTKKSPAKDVCGWREIVSLPELGVLHLRAKVDTGARTSSLHATNIHLFERDGEEWARFTIDAEEDHDQIVEAPRVAHRMITSSNGESQERLIIKTELAMGTQIFRAEFSLADRSDMLFPMLIGRTALRRRFLVDSAKSFLLPDPQISKETDL
jgi:hypothetical protein